MTDIGAAHQAEAALYLSCMEAAGAEDPRPLLEAALESLRGATGAERAYVELVDAEDPGQSRWSASVGLSSEGESSVRDQVSRGVIAATLEQGSTIHTPSALLDGRFRDRKSVRDGEIDAVLCVPISGRGVLGVVYLHRLNRRDERPGGGTAASAGPFPPSAVAACEAVARFVGTIAARLLELARLRKAEDATAPVRLQVRAPTFLGRSRRAAQVLERAGLVARLDANVLLTGSTGCGKSMLARIIHDNSPRAGGPYVELNCATLTENLFESELFGAARGAHSAVAHRGVDGKLDAADGGTLFLDEVGELRIDQQAKLLQFAQDKTYHRLGDSQLRRANVRLIAATNRVLLDEIRNGQFREDLYYRLRGVELLLPGLDERVDDIPLLADHFTAEASRRNGMPLLRISDAAVAALKHQRWPGGIRQLAATCESAAVEAWLQGAPSIEVHHLFGEAPRDDHQALPKTLDAATDDFQRSFVASGLSARDWNVSQTAKDLAVSRSTLNALIRRFGLTRATSTRGS